MAGFARSLLLFLLSVASAAAVYALEIPYLAGRVNDHAQLLSQPYKTRIESSLKALEDATGAQVALLTLPSLEGEALEDYTLRVAQTWALGRKGADNGVLLFVARDDRKLRIEVGYGLEGILTDAACGRIIDRLMLPRFRQGDFEGGIEAAVTAVGGAIRGEAGAIPEAVSESADAAMSIPVMLIVGLILSPFLYLALVLKGVPGWFLYLFLAPFVFVFSKAMGETASMISGGVWLASAPILRLLMPKKWRLEGQSGTGGSSTGGRSSSGFSSSGSGFSGGGGSFGGGGASGSW